MTPFQDAWSLLKNITDMVEYPEGSGNFMSLKDMHEARNAQSRANLAQNQSQQPILNPTERRSMLTHASGRYDPNNPDAMHPMGSGQ